MHSSCGRLVVLNFLLAASPVNAEKYHVYVAWIDATSVVLAWGTTEEDYNSIGRNSRPHGKAKVEMDGRTTIETSRNWTWVQGLRSNEEYDYRIRLNDKLIGEGNVRTYPEQSEKLAFFVIGDWGNGKEPQRQLAEAMYDVYCKQAGTDNPVRFVVSTGDNIYSNRFLFWKIKTGSEDSHWKQKFFDPYKALLAHIPFYPSPGNHDGKESEKGRDHEVYLDNFFFLHSGYFYHFRFARLAEFFAIDSTENLRINGKTIYSENGAQHSWLKERLGAATKAAILWKIPYFHHPPFTAGPRHKPKKEELSHFLELFQEAGVRVVFNGHEHNLQISEESEATGCIRYIVSGAGGQLRTGDIGRDMEQEHIAAWAAKRHFLLVTIEGRTMKISPYGFDERDKSKQLDFSYRDGRVENTLIIELDK